VKNFLKNNWYILLLYLVCIAVSGFFLLNYDKVAIHVYMNQLVGNSFLDNFFYYITYLGDGAVMPFILILIILYNIRLGMCATISFLSAAAVTNILKYQFFSDINRPWQVFKWTVNIPLKYVDASDLHIHNSFPSGHATQAFAIFMCLVFFSRRIEFKLLFFIVAVAAAFSRVHLSQHWLVDVTIGSIIGTISSIVFYYFILERNTLQRFNKSVIKPKKAG
jgi:membrane-associated phospholipid phosphatase